VRGTGHSSRAVREAAARQGQAQATFKVRSPVDAGYPSGGYFAKKVNTCHSKRIYIGGYYMLRVACFDHDLRVINAETDVTEELSVTEHLSICICDTAWAITSSFDTD
jgi:hypothetical protein